MPMCVRLDWRFGQKLQNRITNQFQTVLHRKKFTMFDTHWQKDRNESELLHKSGQTCCERGNGIRVNWQVVQYSLSVLYNFQVNLKPVSGLLGTGYKINNAPAVFGCDIDQYRSVFPPIS